MYCCHNRTQISRKHRHCRVDIGLTLHTPSAQELAFHVAVKFTARFDNIALKLAATSVLWPHASNVEAVHACKSMTNWSQALCAQRVSALWIVRNEWLKLTFFVRWKMLDLAVLLALLWQSRIVHTVICRAYLIAYQADIWIDATPEINKKRRSGPIVILAWKWAHL